MRLGDAGGRIKHGKAGALEDVDHDGDLDLVLHVFAAQLGLEPGDTSLTLTGATRDGTPIEGTGRGRIVGPKKRSRGHFACRERSLVTRVAGGSPQKAD